MQITTASRCSSDSLILVTVLRPGVGDSGVSLLPGLSFFGWVGRTVRSWSCMWAGPSGLGHVCGPDRPVLVLCVGRTVRSWSCVCMGRTIRSRSWLCWPDRPVTVAFLLAGPSGLWPRSPVLFSWPDHPLRSGQGPLYSYLYKVGGLSVREREGRTETYDAKGVLSDFIYCITIFYVAVKKLITVFCLNFY